MVKLKMKLMKFIINLSISSFQNHEKHKQNIFYCTNAQTKDKYKAYMSRKSSFFNLIYL